MHMPAPAVYDMEEVDYFKDECLNEIEDALARIKTQKTGVYVMASTESRVK